MKRTRIILCVEEYEEINNGDGYWTPLMRYPVRIKQDQTAEQAVIEALKPVKMFVEKMERKELVHIV